MYRYRAASRAVDRVLWLDAALASCKSSRGQKLIKTLFGENHILYRIQIFHDVENIP